MGIEFFNIEISKDVYTVYIYRSKPNLVRVQMELP